jgi:hypothetical protein
MLGRDASENLLNRNHELERYNIELKGAAITNQKLFEVAANRALTIKLIYERREDES